MSELVDIRGIAAGGDGVGTLADGRTIFVPRTVPGDRVELRDIVNAKRFARGRVAALVTSGPGRVAPRCRHYAGDECGGCQLQHLDADAQREARRRIVVETLRRLGRVEVDVPAVTPSPREWAYRTKISLAVRRHRIGFHRLGRPDEVFDLVACEIARPELVRLWTAVRAHRALLPRHAEQVVLRIDRRGGRHLLVRSGGTEVWTDARALGAKLAAMDEPVVLWWQPAGGAPRTVFGSREAYPAMVFEQVHPEMGDAVRAFAVEALGSVAGLRVWDLYAGIGETSRALAARGATVESIELDRRAVDLANSLGGERMIRHAGPVEERLPALAPADAAIVNPPRVGLSAEVAEMLVTRAPRRLVYISCDPATLARDLTRLSAGYRVVDVRAFDLFPQTAHVETVTLLESAS